MLASPSRHSSPSPAPSTASQPQQPDERRGVRHRNLEPTRGVGTSCGRIQSPHVNTHVNNGDTSASLRLSGELLTCQHVLRSPGTSAITWRRAVAGRVWAGASGYAPGAGPRVLLRQGPKNAPEAKQRVTSVGGADAVGTRPGRGAQPGLPWPSRREHSPGLQPPARGGASVCWTRRCGPEHRLAAGSSVPERQSPCPRPRQPRREGKAPGREDATWSTCLWPRCQSRSPTGQGWGRSLPEAGPLLSKGSQRPLHRRLAGSSRPHQPSTQSPPWLPIPPGRQDKTPHTGGSHDTHSFLSLGPQGQGGGRFRSW